VHPPFGLRGFVTGGVPPGKNICREKSRRAAGIRAARLSVVPARMHEDKNDDD